MAARQVRSAHTTIARTAARDPLFALDLANAGNEVDVESMRQIREAAKEQTGLLHHNRLSCQGGAAQDGEAN